MSCFQKAGFLALVGLLGWTSASPAQVNVRAPFVRVEVGGPGVYVRAPFVNLFIPAPPPVAPQGELIPKVPAVVPEGANNGQARAISIQDFAESFEAKPGMYEAVLLNPVNLAPTSVRFTLPEGKPQVLVFRRALEFFYGPGHYVRIQFDRQGAAVVTR